MPKSLKIENCITKKSKTCHVILAGDFNSRVGLLQDCPHIQCDDDLAQYLSHNTDIAARDNVDKIINTHGRKLINLCIATGMQIQTGRICNSKFTLGQVLLNSKGV